MRGLAMIVLAVAATPAAAESLSVTGMIAPPAREAALLRSIAVARFTGRDGDALAFAIERRLASPDDDGMRPHFRIVDDSAADGVLSGRGDVSIDEHDYSETRDRCVEKVEKKCVRRERREVGCTRRTIALAADIRLVRRRDGRLVYAVPKAREDSSSWCEDGGSSGDIDRAVRGMIRAVAEEVRRDLAPRRETHSVRLRENRDGMAKPVAAAFKDAVHLSQRDPHAACDAFAAIDAAAPHPSTAYDVAVCAEADGDYARARDGYARVAVWVPGKTDAAKGVARAVRLAEGEAAVEEIRRARGL